MPDVRIFADDNYEMAAVYVDGQLRHYDTFYESDALISALRVLGVEVEYDVDFMLGEEDDPEFENLAQTLGDIEDFRRNRESFMARKQRDADLLTAETLRANARSLLDRADDLERRSNLP